MRDLEEIQITGGNELLVEEIIDDKPPPGFPIMAVRAVEQNDRHDRALARLDEGQHLAAFVVRAEPAGEEGKGVGFLHEVEFAGEEVTEVDEFGVAGDPFVGPLLERQADVQAEAFFRARAFLRRAHDAVAAAGNDHPVVLDHAAGKLAGVLVFLRLRTGAGAAEDSHLADALILAKDGRGVAQFAYGAVVEFELAQARLVLAEPEDGLDHFPNDVGLSSLGHLGNEALDAGIPGFFFHNFTRNGRLR